MAPFSNMPSIGGWLNAMRDESAGIPACNRLVTTDMYMSGGGWGAALGKMANKALGNLNMKDPGCHMEPERWKKHMQYLKKEGVTTGSNGWGGRDARPGEDTAIIETPPPPPPISITQILGPIINTLIHHKGGRTVAMARTSADKLKAALTGGAGKFSSVRTSKQLLDKMKRRAGAMLAAENKRKAIEKAGKKRGEHKKPKKITSALDRRRQRFDAQIRRSHDKNRIVQ